MKVVITLVGLLMVIVGIVGIVSPATILDLTGPLLTPTALLIIAAIRVAFGLVLLGAAGKSRVPATLRILGAFIILAGIATPLIGVENSRAAVEWWSGHGVLFMRVTMVLAVVLGVFLLFAVARNVRKVK
jgi:hypothetical protein